MKLARAFMMFGAPSHRLPTQIQATAHVLDMQLACMYLPDIMLISFDDAATSTSNIKFIAMVDDIGRPEQRIYVRMASEAQLVFVAFACSFLIRVRTASSVWYFLNSDFHMPVVASTTALRLASDSSSTCSHPRDRGTRDWLRIRSMTCRVEYNNNEKSARFFVIFGQGSV